MVHGDDPTRRSIIPNRDLDPTYAEPQPWFVGSGRGLMIVVVAAVVLLLLVRITSTIWMADRAWRWWWAPVATKLNDDPAGGPRVVRPVTPIGSQAAWFTGDDYPEAARRGGEQGRVSVKLLVEFDGYPSACEVRASSGSRAFDETTCRLAVRRGRFTPALASDGTPVRATFPSLDVAWRLEG